MTTPLLGITELADGQSNQYATANTAFRDLEKLATSSFDGRIESASDKDYIVRLNLAFGGEISQVSTISESGTCTATFKINSTSLGGAASSVSISEQTQAHASSNVFVAGDDITITVSSNSSCVGICWAIHYVKAIT